MTTTRRNRIALGAAAGLLSAAAGVGVSLVVSVLVGGAPTPITAVGSRVIDATPGPIKDWAIRTLGTYDKPALLGGIFTILALVAAVTGVVAWRSRRLALALTVVLGLVGLGAALADPSQLTGTYSRIAPALAALVASVGMLAWFTRGWDTRSSAVAAQPGGVHAATLDDAPTHHGSEDLVSSDTPVSRHRSENPAPAGFDRRAFLAAALVSGAAAATGFGTSRIFGDVGASSRASIELPKASSSAAALQRGVALDVKGISSYLTSNADFYRVDTALSIPQISAGDWTLKIHGLVDDEIELTYEDLLAMPLIERRVTLTCVSNEVGGPYVGNATWLGVRFKDLLDQVGVSADADAVKSTAIDGFTIGTPLSALTDDRDAMIAIGMNGVPLPLDNGFPARMVVPGLYGYVSATKWLVDLEVTRFEDFSAYWTDRGWDAEAPIKTMSRIDVPGAFEQITPGRAVTAGVAWAQNTGIEKVEVRIDGGTWQQATLAKEDSIDTWRQWFLEWDATPGLHDIEARATDKSGYTQTSRRVPPRPNGATGWQKVDVTVTDG